MRHRLLPLSGSPVLGFTSKRGKLLLDISKRILWPRWKTSDVGYISSVKFVRLPWLKELRLCKMVSVTCPDDTVSYVQIDSGGKIGAGRIDVDQLDCEIGVRGIGSSPERDYQPASHFHVLVQRLGLEDENIVPGR